jgi:4-amino-4-deoxy-L-arabinose transferase-like glycosyltransferase
MTKFWLGDTQIVWIISVLAGALFLATNLPWQLDDYDQAKQAYTSFEMVKEGHWLYQHTPHERIATKPPLIGWISSGIFSVTRSWAIAWRLPSLLSAIALSILLFRAGSVYGAVAGLISLSAFAFNLLTPRLATLVRTDMSLALVIFAIGFLIWDKIRRREPWNARDRLWMFTLLTVAMLIKGPIVYAFLLPGIVALKFWECRRHACLHSWSGWWPWIVSLSIFLIWVIGGSIFVPGFYDQVVIREFLGRFGETVHRPQPFLFYFPHLFHKFFPWSVLMIGCAIFEFNRLRKLDGLKPSSFRERLRLIKFSPEMLWLFLWIFGGLIVMSIIPSKRVDRIFPIVPPLCLLLATQIGNALNNERIGRRVLQWSGAALVLSILFASGYSGFKVFTGYRDHRDALVIFGFNVQKATGYPKIEVLESKDEGLLLYLEQLHFVSRQRAIAEWNGGGTNALVVPEQKAAALIQELQNAKIAPLKSETRADQPSNYVLIGRAE